MTRDELAHAFAPVIAEAASYWCDGDKWCDLGPAGCAERRPDGWAKSCQCKDQCYQLADIALTSSSEPTAEAPPAAAGPG